MQKTDHEYCLRCGRKLKNPAARERGYGVICLKKLKTDSQIRSKLFSQFLAGDKIDEKTEL